jgi:ABC-type Fe3+/spermidine/putrescine transport system ATPase subunit
VTRFVAEFLGDSNVFTGVLHESDPVVRLDEDGLAMRIADPRGAVRSEPVAVLVRPEHLHVMAPGTAPERFPNRLSGVVSVVHYGGTSRRVEIETPSGRKLFVRTPSRTEFEAVEGALVEVVWAPEDCVVIADDGTAGSAAEPAGEQPMVPAVELA